MKKIKNKTILITEQIGYFGDVVVKKLLLTVNFVKQDLLA